MRTIYKYPLRIEDRQDILVPAFATPIKVGLDPNGVPSLWAIVVPENPIETLRVWIVGTGHPVPAEVGSGFYLDSFNDGPFVWHVFTS